MNNPVLWQTVWVTFKLALITTIILIGLGIPFSLWIVKQRANLKSTLQALISIPIVLPPTVLGFYLLIFLGPEGALGKLTNSIGIGHLSFTFTGLVIGSVLYSLPFVINPLVSTFENINRDLIEAAASLGANRKERLFRIILPIARPGIISAAIIGFAHTVGEFGVILMIGGSIPGKTKVLSVAIYDHVESLEYAMAHKLSLGMLVFSFITLFILFKMKKSHGSYLE